MRKILRQTFTKKDLRSSVARNKACSYNRTCAEECKMLACLNVQHIYNEEQAYTVTEPIAFDEIKH